MVVFLLCMGIRAWRSEEDRTPSVLNVSTGNLCGNKRLIDDLRLIQEQKTRRKGKELG